MSALKIALKDLKAVSREKTIVLAVLLLLSMSSLSNIVAMGLAILFSPSFYHEVKIGLVGNAPIFESIAKPVKFESLQNALSSLAKGEVEAVLVFNENLTRANHVTIYLPKDDIRAVKSVPYLRKVLMEYQDELRKLKGIPTLKLEAFDESGRKIEVPEGTSIQFRFIYLVLIPTLVILTAIITSMFVIDSVCEEIETKTLELLATAVSFRDIVAGKVLASVIISATLTVFWLLALLLNDIAMNVLQLLYASFVFYSLTIPIALMLATTLKNREKAQLVFSLLVIPIILTFLSFEHSPIALIVKAGVSVADLHASIFYGLTALVIGIIAIAISEKELKKAVRR
jgi:hypothetical protein